MKIVISFDCIGWAVFFLHTFVKTNNIGVLYCMIIDSVFVIFQLIIYEYYWVKITITCSVCQKNF